MQGEDIEGLAEALFKIGTSVRNASRGMESRVDYSSTARSTKPNKIAAAKKRHAKKKANRRNKR